MYPKWIFLCWLIWLSGETRATTILVKNEAELVAACKKAVPGDSIVLQNGEWRDIALQLNRTGTPEKPIVIKAETRGKAVLTGHSRLKIGGSYIIVDGLYFTNGYAGTDAVITFRTSSNELANHCRVTHTVIRDFNNPKRLSDNYWVALYGKNNQLDHCSFINKTNLGVLLAVILDDERSRENFHRIDHNYFGYRMPLASNAGEIIRIGVSEHCQFNSNTEITDNYFEHCDGEGEVISVKSCKNVVRNNVFKECQGSVVLRHGNNNLVENNLFYGNNKEGSGGVRVINKGQWVVNNYFYRCRGTGFRSPLSIMNGIPNSPANRYLEVADAVICNNTFFECSPISFCEGSDAERTVQPYRVEFRNNLFYTSKDTQVYYAFDDISKIRFSGNVITAAIRQSVSPGFVQRPVYFSATKNNFIPRLTVRSVFPLSDSLALLSKERMTGSLSATPGTASSADRALMADQLRKGCGAGWFREGIPPKRELTIRCKTAEDIMFALEKNKGNNLHLQLTATTYRFTSPLRIQSNVRISSGHAQPVTFSFASAGAPHCILLEAGHSLSLQNLVLDLEDCLVQTFITTDTSGGSSHSNFSMKQSTVLNCPGTFLTAARSSVCDSVIITGCSFIKGKGTVLNMRQETDNKGYYNAERIVIQQSSFSDIRGQIMAILRSGKDESTMGPMVIFSGNKLDNCIFENPEGLLSLSGVQRSVIEKNKFNSCNTGKILIQYTDWVRASHFLRNNSSFNSGTFQVNEFVRMDK